MSVVFAAIVPHPPIMLPDVGDKKDKEKISKTIESMYLLEKEMSSKNIDKIIITSPHSDWGFDVPLYFLNQKLQKNTQKILINETDPKISFEDGKDFYNKSIKSSPLSIAIIASGDLSHRLKEDGPYGLHQDGLNFDEDILLALANKEVTKLLNLNNLYPEAGECGLNSISFLTGVLEAREKDYLPNIISYEKPFGVGYLVLNYLL